MDFGTLQRKVWNVRVQMFNFRLRREHLWS